MIKIMMWIFLVVEIFLISPVLWADSHGNRVQASLMQSDLEQITNFDCEQYIEDNFSQENEKKSKKTRDEKKSEEDQEKIELSKKLNRLGFQTYQKNELAKAASLFRCAWVGHPQYALAQYNYASTLSLLQYRVLDPCDLSYLKEIKQHLTLSIQLDSQRRSRMQKDSDFMGMHKFSFYRLLSLPPKTSTENILLRIKDWHGPVPGVYPTSRLTFRSGRRVTLHRFLPQGKGVSEVPFPATSKMPTWDDPIQGKYALKGENLNITFENSKIKTLKGKLKINFDHGTLNSAVLELENFEDHTPEFGKCGL